ncbi:DUF3224 domain-containing protein [Brevundimonas mediterranea]|uniref:DUF3224 domain-containing protein n=1 Tax=Brevundimonas mediterranea TaxID=74329 RepID=A0A7W6EYF6_9CAUL|nr:DUF3224 domain-containing protein [Brevundimonas mediterranea]MBB3870895.1 hypothetical protein [Brevundimonas mediterranea]
MIALVLTAALASSVIEPQTAPQSAAAAAAVVRSPAMSHAAGTFEVKITPVAPEPDAPADTHGRMKLAKTFHGDLEGTGVGEMLGIMAGQSGAYVAMERVMGVLNGRQGGFSMVHRGVMNAGSQELLITIVPGSGRGDLTGISGVFHLTIADGEHRYMLDYSLPE